MIKGRDLKIEIETPDGRKEVLPVEDLRFTKHVTGGASMTTWNKRAPYNPATMSFELMFDSAARLDEIRDLLFGPFPPTVREFVPVWSKTAVFVALLLAFVVLVLLIGGVS